MRRAELIASQISAESSGVAGLAMRTGEPSTFAIGIQERPRGTAEASVITGEDGRFEFAALRTGDWRLTVETDEMRGAGNVLVRRGDVEDLQIRIAAPFRLTGTVEGKPEDMRASALLLVEADGNEFVRSGFLDSGRFSFDNILPGRYRILPGAGLSAQIFLGPWKPPGKPFRSAPASRRSVLKASAGTVRGTAEEGEGATVVLIPQRIDGIAIGQTAKCGPGGSFEPKAVSPGDYYIAAVGRIDGLWPSATNLSLVRSQGMSVKVEEGSATSVSVTVIAVPGSGR